MSKMLSLKLRENVFEEVEKITKKINMPRNAYINDALEVFNKLNKRRILKRKLLKEVASVKASSEEVLSEFEKLEDELPG